MFEVRRAVGLLACALASATSMSAPPADAGSAAEINRDKTTGYYSTVAASYGLQAGVSRLGTPCFS